MKHKLLIINLFSLFLLAFDRLSKLFFLKFPQTFIIFPEQLYFKLHKNTGIFFGWLNINWLYFAVTIALILLLGYLWIKIFEVKKIYQLFILNLLFIGAISNLWDRFRYGGVIDFINFFDWSIFNLADIYITCGALIWLGGIIYAERKKISKTPGKF